MGRSLVHMGTTDLVLQKKLEITFLSLIFFLKNPNIGNVIKFKYFVFRAT
jgi:hypothetical protein